VQASAAARINLRVPPGITARQARDALEAHLRRRVPWSLRCVIETVAEGDPFVGTLSGPAFDVMKESMEAAFGRELATEGQGGSIPLCNVLRDTYPEAEIFLMGVEEPQCLIHAPNESVDPSEIEHVALAEAIFLERYARAVR
jgi:acetylornithine deacetylase/succinyl-diaminopimelate desuccinylase-like protein